MLNDWLNLRGGPKMKCLLFSVVLIILPLQWKTSLVEAVEGDSDWRVEWKRIQEAAKREGQVSIYIYGSTAPLDSGVFQKAYPEIKVFSVTGLGGQIEQRIMSERRAGKFLADVVVHGVTPNYTEFYPAKILEPVKPALMFPEVVDESKWWGGKHRYTDPEGKYVFVMLGTPQRDIAYNTTLVNPSEFRSHWDFLNPKWKGKILARDIRGSYGAGTGGSIFLYHQSGIGPEFIRRFFAEMDVTLFRDFRQAADWLGVGKFSICFFCGSGDVERAKKQGLPADLFGPMKEGAGLAPQRGTVVLMNRAPHPNAARVFVNWLLSKEGQMVYQKLADPNSASDSLRIDIPKDGIPPDRRRLEGVPYLDLSRAELLDVEPIYKVISEGLKEAGKR